MAQFAYSSPAGRINEILGEILAHAEPVEVLSLGCTMKKVPKNKGATITYRRYLPYGGATTNANTINRWSVNHLTHLVQEGVTPPADTLTPHDVSTSLNQYAVVYCYTDKTADLYEDDIPEEAKMQCGERSGLVREMVRYGEMKACTNVIYAGGTSRATVDEAISLPVVRRMTKTLKANHAKMKSRILGPGPNYDTAAIEAGYHVFVHTNAEPDIRDLPDFTVVAKYANRSPISPYELGSCEGFRFMTSPELAAYADSGAAVGTTGLVSTSASQIDVYPFIVVGQDCTYDIGLRGVDSMKVNHIPHTQTDKADILGQRGYVTAQCWSAVLNVNNGWMGVIEAGVTNV